MGRAFKDLIVQEADGRPRLTFRSRDGAAVLEDVSVEVAGTVLQEGDRWGALAANQLLELDAGGVPYAVAPEFTPAAKPAAPVSRERMSAAFGKLAAAVSALIAHLADGVKHITAAERKVWNGKADAAAVNSALAGKAAASHTHDGRYYTEAETDNLLAGKAASSHTHDSRYYTEAETNSLLAGKAASSHTHDSRYYTEAETNSLLAGKAASSHTHDGRYYTETETDNLLAGKADASSVNNALAGKANTSGTYTGLTAGNSQKLGGKTLSMTLSGDTLSIEWR